MYCVRSVVASLLVATLGIAAPALADNVNNDTASGRAEQTVDLAVGASLSVRYWIEATGGSGDPQGGCNANDGTSPTVVPRITLDGGPSDGVTFSPPSHTFTACRVAQTFNDRTFTFTAREPGFYRVDATVSDPNTGPGAGTYKTFQSVYHINVADTRDSTPPTIHTPGSVGPVEGNALGGAVVTYAASAQDTFDGAVAPSCSPPSGSLFPVGTTTVTCTATDAAGNVASSSFAVTVVDTVPPSIDAPAPLGPVEGNALGGSTVNWPGPTAVDTVAGPVPVSCDRINGSLFPLGTTVVACTATDGTNTASVSFSVTVVDTTAPTVSVSSDLGPIEGNTLGGATVSFDPPTASDVVWGTVDATCDANAGDVFSVGTTVVTCSATDGSGNTGSQRFAIEVVDTTPPALTLPGPISAVATRSSGADVSYSASAYDIVDGNLAVTCGPSAGAFALGTTIVGCSATDVAGNRASASFTVSVTYCWDGFLSPIPKHGAPRFKLGSTVPVKFKLCGASAGIADATAKLTLAKVTDEVEGPRFAAKSTSQATSGNLFRYDATDDQYIFNAATKGLAAGTYALHADLGDGVDHTVRIVVG